MTGSSMALIGVKIKDMQIKGWFFFYHLKALEGSAA